MSDQPGAETYTCKTHNTHNRQTSMPPVGFKPTISATERPQTQALEVVSSVIGNMNNYIQQKSRF